MKESPRTTKESATRSIEWAKIRWGTSHQAVLQTCTDTTPSLPVWQMPVLSLERGEGKYIWSVILPTSLSNVLVFSFWLTFDWQNHLIDRIVWLTESVVVFRCRCIIRAKAAASETGADAERRRAGEGDAQWHCANPTRSWNRRRLWSGSVRNWGWQLTIWLFYHYACAVIVMPCSSFSDGRLGPLCISVILCCC